MIKNIIGSFFILSCIGCTDQKTSSFVGNWELTSITIKEQGRPEERLNKMPYELMINNDGTSYAFNAKGVLFDSARWFYDKNELKFSKSLFTY